MYRENDTSLAATIREQLTEGQSDQALASLGSFVLSRPDDGDVIRDENEASVWAAVTKHGLARDATKLSLELFEGGETLRPRSFARLVHNLALLRDKPPKALPGKILPEEGTRLLEMARVLLTRPQAAWGGLGPIFFRFIEAEQKRKLWGLLEVHLESLRAPSDTWLLVALAVATTSMPIDVAEWLSDLPTRRGLPPWAITVYAHYVLDNDLPAEDLRRLLHTCSAPEPEADLHARRAMAQALHGRKWDEFQALAQEHRSLLSGPFERGFRNPLVEHFNQYKDHHQLRPKDFDGTPADDSNAAIVRLVSSLPALGDGLSYVLGLFDELLRLEYGQGKEATELWRRFRRFKKHDGLVWSKTAWQAAIKTRTQWSTRLKYSIIG